VLHIETTGTIDNLTADMDSLHATTMTEEEECPNEGKYLILAPDRHHATTTTTNLHPWEEADQDLHQETTDLPTNEAHETTTSDGLHSTTEERWTDDQTWTEDQRWTEDHPCTKIDLPETSNRARILLMNEDLQWIDQESHSRTGICGMLQEEVDHHENIEDEEGLPMVAAWTETEECQEVAWVEIKETEETLAETMTEREFSMKDYATHVGKRDTSPRTAHKTPETVGAEAVHQWSDTLVINMATEEKYHE
jgi:hypothetical protein